MTKDEALKMCLEYIETNAHERKYVRHAIKEALSKPSNPGELEPVAYIGMIDEDHFADVCRKANGNSNTPLYAALPQRKPLSDEEIWQTATDCTIGGDLHADKFARAIEAAHGIKENT